MRCVVERFVPQPAVFPADGAASQRERNVITSDPVDAWCMPGGKAAAYTGLSARLQGTDHEPAAVIGHEIARALHDAREWMGPQAAMQRTTAIDAAALAIFTDVRG